LKYSTEKLEEKLSRQACPEQIEGTPSTQRKIPCHFDPFGQAQGKLREKSFLDPSHSLGMTGLGPSPWRPFDLAQDMLCVFARVTGIFDCIVPIWFKIVALSRIASP